jgi:ABC-type glutathione transport system ATPase component
MDAMTAPNPRPLLEVQRLTVVYARRRAKHASAAVEEVSFVLRTNETLGIVGESGSGKTTVARAILGLAPASSGRILFDGRDITHLSTPQRRGLAADLSVIFQDPYSSLNPSRTIGQTLEEAFGAIRRHERRAIRPEMRALLDRVGMPSDALDRYPRSFSGGQRQRIAIARALARRPRLIICDEPVSALDLSIQAQVLNLLRELQIDLELSLLFISHDLAIVRHMSHRVLVMHHGRIVEEGTPEQLYARPSDPYTKTLIASAPLANPRAQRERRRRRRQDATQTSCSST